ncbi:ion transporter [Halorussus salinus]|uniref:ion transporter n=1 Tax=Halorussus salinus TaxID=1364935 RepID=UPI00192FA343|nr:ion transporter [Halorussus salinus]
MPHHVRRRIFDIFEVGDGGRLGRTIDLSIMTLIIGNVAAVILATVPTIHDQYGDLLFAFEVLSVTVFTLEYLARVATCTTHPDYSHPITGRLRFMLQPYLIIDLLAILPFFVGFFLFDLRVLRALRLFRFFRLFKLTKYSNSITRFGAVIHEKKEDLVVALSATSVLLLVASSLMYYVEHDAQPEKFTSILDALWWGVATLTTVGYGDVYPVTPAGKALGALIATLGVGLFALPASILASGFIEAAGSDREYCPHCGERLDT